MKPMKRFLILAVLAAMAAFCMAPGLAFAGGGDINQQTLNENGGIYTINEGGIYDLTENVDGSIYVANPTSAVKINLKGHKLTNNENEYALKIEQSNDVSVTVDGQDSTGERQYGSIVQTVDGNPAIKVDASSSAKIYLNSLEVKTQGAECLEALNGEVRLTNVDMSGSQGSSSLIHTNAAAVFLNSGTYNKSDSSQALFNIENGGKIELSGGSFNEFPKGTTLGEYATLYKQAAGNYEVKRPDDSGLLSKHCWKVTLTDKTQILYSGDTKDIYFGLGSEAKAFDGGKYADTAVEINADDATALTDDAVSINPSSYISDGTQKKPEVSVSVGGTPLTEGEDYVVSYESNIDPGTAYAVVEGINEYKGTVKKSFEIVNKVTPVSTNISAAKVTLSKTAFTYNGKAQKPSVKSVVLNGKTLKAGTDYTASIASGKKVGTYNVTVTAKGSYTGKASTSFVINPKGVTKLKVSKAKKAFKAKWKKNKTERSGVQVKYSTKKSMKNAKTVKAKGASVKAKKVKKLKKKTKYYVQVRAYKTVGGKTYYSSWSAKKAVKTK